MATLFGGFQQMINKALNDQVRSLLASYANTRSKATLDRIEQIKDPKDSLFLQLRILRYVCLAGAKGEVIDYAAITKRLYAEIFKRLAAADRQKQGERLTKAELHEALKPIIGLFAPACSWQSIPKDLRDATLWSRGADGKPQYPLTVRCEGTCEKDYHQLTRTNLLVKEKESDLGTWCNLPSCSKCGFAIEFDHKRQVLTCPMCQAEGIQLRVSCPTCHSGSAFAKLTFSPQKWTKGQKTTRQDAKKPHIAVGCAECQASLHSVVVHPKTNVYKKKTDARCTTDGCGSNLQYSNTAAHCSACKATYLYQYGDVWWCFGRACIEPQAFRRKEAGPWDVTIHHFDTERSAARLASWMNRLMLTLPHCFCRDCGTLLTPDLQYAKDLSFFKATVFRCENPDCLQYDRGIYINTCNNEKCHGVIDSRDSTKKCPNGFYICKNCYACCHEYLFRRSGADKERHGHREQNQIFCPHCAAKLSLQLSPEPSFVCTGCRRTLPIKSEHWYWKNWPQLRNALALNSRAIRHDSLTSS